MSRTWVSFLTVLFYALAQYGILFFAKAGFFTGMSKSEIQYWSVNIQVILFIIATFLIIWIQFKIKNPTKLEQGTKEQKRYIIPFAIIGTFIVFIYQIFASLIITKIFNFSAQSPNTEQLITMAKSFPLLIIVIAIFGPILEEFVFRKVIFGEIFNKLRGDIKVRFIIATLVSSSLFAVFHDDPTHIIIYFGMGIIFSWLYVYTKRIIVPILVHIFQNTFVAIIQITQGENIAKLQPKVDALIQFFI